MLKNQSDRTKGIMALIFLALVTASMGIYARILSTEFTILQQVYLRIIVALVLGVIFFHRDIHLKKLKNIPAKEWTLLFIRAVFTYLLGVTLFSHAVTLAKISNVSFISALPFIALFGFLFLREKVTLHKFFFLLLGFVGVVLVAVKDYSNIFSWGTGELIALASSCALAFSKVARKWQSNMLNNKEIAVIMFLISSLVIATVSVINQEQLSIVQTWPPIIFYTLLIAGLANVAFLYLVNYGFQKIEASLANNLLMFEAIFAIILGFIFYREIPTIKELIGGTLILLSAYLMNRSNG